MWLSFFCTAFPFFLFVFFVVFRADWWTQEFFIGDRVVLSIQEQVVFGKVRSTYGKGTEKGELLGIELEKPRNCFEHTKKEKNFDGWALNIFLSSFLFVWL
jgi:hypothetical protein